MWVDIWWWFFFQLPFHVYLFRRMRISGKYFISLLCHCLPSIGQSYGARKKKQYKLAAKIQMDNLICVKTTDWCRIVADILFENARRLAVPFFFYWNHTFILNIFALFIVEISFVLHLPIFRWKMYTSNNTTGPSEWQIQITL